MRPSVCDELLLHARAPPYCAQRALHSALGRLSHGSPIKNCPASRYSHASGWEHHPKLTGPASRPMGQGGLINIDVNSTETIAKRSRVFNAHISGSGRNRIWWVVACTFLPSLPNRLLARRTDICCASVDSKWPVPHRPTADAGYPTRRIWRGHPLGFARSQSYADSHHGAPTELANAETPSRL